MTTTDMELAIRAAITDKISEKGWKEYALERVEGTIELPYSVVLRAILIDAPNGKMYDIVCPIVRLAEMPEYVVEYRSELKVAISELVEKIKSGIVSKRKEIEEQKVRDIETRNKKEAIELSAVSILRGI
jgi:hypothetical protein